jgi:hypothetical protein
MVSTGALRPGGRFLTRNQAVKAASSHQEVCVFPVQPGDAIAFYSYYQDGSFEWNAVHAGLPTVLTDGLRRIGTIMSRPINVPH